MRGSFAGQGSWNLIVGSGCRTSECNGRLGGFARLAAADSQISYADWINPNMAATLSITGAKRARLASLLGLIVALILLSGCRGPVERQVGSDAEPRDREPAGHLVYLFPEQLPEGMELDKLEEYNLPRERMETGGYGAVTGLDRGNSEFAEIVHVVVHEADNDREIESDERKQYETVDVNGVPARFRDDKLLGSSLDWFQDGLAVGLIGPPDQRKVVIAIGRGLRLPTTGDPTGVRLGPLPEGHTLIAEKGYGSFMSASYSFGATSREGPKPRTLVVSVSTVPEGAFAPEAMTAGTDRLTQLRIRGTVAVAAYSSRELPSSDKSVTVDSTSIAWLEYPDVLVTIIASGITEKEATLFAEGLEELAEPEWRSRFGR